MNISLTFIVIAAVIVIIALISGVKIIKPWQKGVVETLGRYTKTLNSGPRIIIPFLQSVQLVDMREQVVDVPSQEVITKDNVVVTVDAVVYLEVVDPFNFVYNIANFWLAITKLAQTNLRNLIGDMSLDESLVSRDAINTRLREVLDQATDKWGTRVTRVEIQRIEPPRDVAEAMHRQMKAERDRRARILEAEGEKRAAILVAEGEKESKIRKAEGEAQAIKAVAEAQRFEKLTVAEGEAIAIKRVFEAIHEGRPTEDLIAIKYLESLKDIANGQATKLFLPYESSGILGSLGAIGELFGKDKTTAQ
ncbi:MAG: SPFH/Band 7/PHB domain protein [Candidatus Dadabacteria bacterium]|nr:MAG: SPFH/Band 7/PHB domain protein [Candidatus Dadabacteria bacterium]